MDSAPEPRFMERAIALALEGVRREAGGPFGATKGPFGPTKGPCGATPMVAFCMIFWSF